MKVRVKFFAAFREIFGAEEKEIELDSGAGVQDLLRILCDLGRCREKMLDETGRLRRDVKMLKKGWLGCVAIFDLEGEAGVAFPFCFG
jgi:molybdopterin converting factor small subunit